MPLLHSQHLLERTLNVPGSVCLHQSQQFFCVSIASAMSALQASTRGLQVFMLPSNAVLDEATLAKIISSGHSRVPIYRRDNRCSLLTQSSCLLCQKHSKQLSQHVQHAKHVRQHAQHVQHAKHEKQRGSMCKHAKCTQHAKREKQPAQCLQHAKHVCVPSCGALLTQCQFHSTA